MQLQCVAVTNPPPWQMLVLWLDCDREGENIATEVRQVCTEANNRLNVRRARFSALTCVTHPFPGLLPGHRDNRVSASWGRLPSRICVAQSWRVIVFCCRSTT